MTKKITGRKGDGVRGRAHIFPSDNLQALVAINICHRVQTGRHEPVLFRPFAQGDVRSAHSVHSTPNLGCLRVVE